jgi:hypothetical protein
MNRSWHEQHKLDRRATLDERVLWHLEHAEECGCRAIPESVLEEIERRRLSSDGTE